MGTSGTIPRLSMAWTARTTAGPIPECPFKKALSRMASAARTTSGSK
jgi:hypothetical protein